MTKAAEVRDLGGFHASMNAMKERPYGSPSSEGNRDAVGFPYTEFMSWFIW